MSEIQIPAFRGRRGYLSNMYEAPITLIIDDTTPISFTCAESAFQAIKFPSHMSRFTNLSGVEAKRLAKTLTLRSDWDDVKIPAMCLVLKAKFTQNPHLAEKLKKETDEDLIEYNNWGDTYWGVCNGVGTNMLGLILRQLRDELLSDNINCSTLLS